MSLNNLPENLRDHILNDEEFLEAELQMGIGFHNREFITSCRNTAHQFLKFKDITTVIDYGAGTGVYSKGFFDSGYKVLAVEKFAAHRSYMQQHAPKIPVYSIEEAYGAGRTDTDLMLFIEVAEHMTDDEIKEMLSHLNPKYMLFSSTSEVTEHDEAWGHINIKQQDDWISFWKSLGFQLVDTTIMPTTWSKIFRNDNYRRAD